MDPAKHPISELPIIGKSRKRICYQANCMEQGIVCVSATSMIEAVGILTEKGYVIGMIQQVGEYVE